MSELIANVLRQAYDEGAINATAYLNLISRFADALYDEDGRYPRTTWFNRAAFIDACRVVRGKS